MKTKMYFLLALLIFLCGMLKAQNNRELTIIYDLKTGLLEYKGDKGNKGDKAKYNLVGDAGHVKISLKNVNPYIYNIKISELQNIRMDDTQVGKINNMSFYNAISYEVKDVSYSNPVMGVKEINYNSPELKQKEKAVTDKEVKIVEAISNFNLLLINKPSKNDSAGRDTIADNYTKKINIDKQEIEKLIEEKRSLEKNLDKLVQESNNGNNRLLLYNRKIKDLIVNLKGINDIAVFYQALLNIMYTDGDDTFDMIVLKRNLINKVFPTFTNDDNITVFLNGIVSRASASYSDVAEYYSLISNSFSEDPNIKPELLKSFNGISNIVSQVKQEELMKFIGHVDRTYNSINKKSLNSIYYANIVNDDADFIRFTIEGTPVSGLPPSVNVRTFNVVVEVPIKGGVKLDLSTGILNTFGLFNKTYRYEKASTTGSYTVVENEQKSLLNPNLGLLLHLYRRNSIENFRPAVSLGLGLSEDQKVRYFGGTSGIFGRKQRFIISMGAVAWQINFADQSVLGKELSLSTEELLKPIPNRTPTPYRIGAFLGFTFNLTGSNSEFAGRVNGIAK